MALLSAQANGWLARASGALALVALVWGCVLFQSGARRYAFSHALHADELDIACSECHPAAKTSDEPGMPAPAACAECHDKLDALKPLSERVGVLFDGDRFRAAHAMHVGDEVIFSHARHATALKVCSLCHADMQTNAVVGSELALSMAQCSDCHAQRGAPNECSTCHSELRADVAPASHAAQWEKRHGRCARDGERTVDRCELCHREETCVQCHRSEPPESHTPHWLRKGHGASAMFDRQNCAACHEPDSCERCHRETEPLSHGPSFGAPRSNHCFGCHQPLAEQGCAACHSGTPSHALAPPKPDDPFHIKGMNCRQCHGPSAPLPHADNGDDCNACHH